MKIARLFLFSAAVVLLFTAAAKFISGISNARVLLQIDPLTGFQFRDLFFIAATLETFVALFCAFNKQIWISAMLVAWLATNLLIYRVGLLLVGWHKPCSCLGNFTDILHIPPRIADTAMKIVLAYLLLCSYATLIWLWRQKHKVSLLASSSETATSSAS